MNIIKRLATGAVLLAGTWSAAGQEIIEYIHTDALGSPVAVSDAAGNVIERTAYEPYGALIGLQQADVPRFTGHVADSGTGLTYMQQRYYDPQIGLLLSADPVTAYSDPVAAFNRYRYANSSPYKFIDPDGRRACGQNTTCALKSGAAGSTSYINDGNRKFPSGTEQRRYDSASAIVDKVSAVVESRKNECLMLLPNISQRYFSLYLTIMAWRYRQILKEVMWRGGTCGTLRSAVNLCRRTESGLWLLVVLSREAITYTPIRSKIRLGIGMSRSLEMTLCL